MTSTCKQLRYEPLVVLTNSTQRIGFQRKDNGRCYLGLHMMSRRACWCPAAMLVSQTNPQGIEFFHFCFGWKTWQLITWVKISNRVYTSLHKGIHSVVQALGIYAWSDKLAPAWFNVMTLNLIAKRQENGLEVNRKLRKLSHFEIVRRKT